MSQVAGVKSDNDKPRVDLVPVSGITAAARAFTFGANKYSPWNWTKGLEWLRLYAAILRHLFAWFCGETNDPESGLHPLDHALASLFMLQAHVERGLGKDDRPEKLLEEMPIPIAHVPKHSDLRYKVMHRTSAGNVRPSSNGGLENVLFVTRDKAQAAIDSFGSKDCDYFIEAVEK